MRILYVTLLLAVALASCSGPRVLTNQDPEADFRAYRTFGYPATLGTDNAEYSSLLSGFLKQTATRELEARGYELADEPDLLVNFYLHTQEKVRTTQSPSGYYSYRGYGAWGGYGVQTTVTQYTEGTLNVDLVDRGRNQVVWEGVLVGRVTDEARENLQKAADEALAEIFAEYPYTARRR